MNVLESIRLVTGLNRNSNSNDIKIFEHLFDIKESKVWTNPKYYVNAAELEYLAKRKFQIFISTVFDRNIRWYQSMEAILKMPNGRELLLQWGRVNMATYMNLTKDEQEAVVEAATTVKRGGRIPNFYRVSVKLFGKRRMTDADKVKEGYWEGKYRALSRRHDTLIAKHKEVKAENVSLRKQLAKIKTVMGAI